MTSSRTVAQQQPQSPFATCLETGYAGLKGTPLYQGPGGTQACGVGVGALGWLLMEVLGPACRWNGSLSLLNRQVAVGGLVMAAREAWTERVK